MKMENKFIEILSMNWFLWQRFPYSGEDYIFKCIGIFSWRLILLFKVALRMLKTVDFIYSFVPVVLSQTQLHTVVLAVQLVHSP